MILKKNLKKKIQVCQKKNNYLDWLTSEYQQSWNQRRIKLFTLFLQKNIENQELVLSEE